MGARSLAIRAAVGTMTRTIASESATIKTLFDQMSHNPVLKEKQVAGLVTSFTINERVTALWREQGQHACLHHLNALFGY